MALALDLLHFQVGNRRVQFRVPVHKAFVLVNQTFPVQFDKDFRDRFRAALIHGETFARPVGRRPEGAELVGDGAAGLSLPLPDLLEKCLATDIAPVDLLCGKLPFDHGLRRDAGMVRSRLPQSVFAGLALVPNQDVLNGEGERVAHMQAAGDVRRRHHDGVRNLARAGIGSECARFFPVLVMGPLNRGRFECLSEHGDAFGLVVKPVSENR